MNRASRNVAAIGLSVGLLSGCGSFGEQEVVQSARVVGYAQGVEAEIIGDRPVHHAGEAHLPYDAYNVNSYEVQTGCSEVDNDWYYGESDQMDSPDCWLEFCDSDTTTHCEPDIEDRYDFDRVEEVVLQNCIAEYPRREYKAEPYVDTDCIENPPANTRVRKVLRHFLWFSTKNPAKDAEHPDLPDAIVDSLEVSTEVWNQADHARKFTVTIRDGDIVSVKAA